ncbi:hypothetical protein F2P56_019029 [Juglans regia]|uniref:Uncharacterized protein n=1 Tax=Juglans regia TaxID=51240 RepID=A0A833UBB7_JUGRE|nr:hypothetical protein F2P56_019029 [Juglans regia]
MISSIAWLPKGAAKPVPSVADPPSKEEIEEMIKSGAFDRSGDGDSTEEDDEDMDTDATMQADKAAHALEVADALGRTSNNMKSERSFDDVTNGLKELDMEHYDEEDDGIPSA